MSTPAGDLELLEHPVAQLNGAGPACLQLVGRHTADHPHLVPLGRHGHRFHHTAASSQARRTASQPPGGSQHRRTCLALQDPLRSRGRVCGDAGRYIPGVCRRGRTLFRARARDGLGGAVTRPAERADPCDASVGQPDRLRNAIPERARGLRARSCLSQRHRVRAGRGADQQGRRPSNPGPHSRTGSERSAWH
jgi:hypothetical protein